MDIASANSFIEVMRQVRSLMTAPNDSNALQASLIDKTIFIGTS
jgi:hypothetical protein